MARMKFGFYKLVENEDSSDGEFYIVGPGLTKKGDMIYGYRLAVHIAKILNKAYEQGTSDMRSHGLWNTNPKKEAKQ